MRIRGVEILNNEGVERRAHFAHRNVWKSDHKEFVRNVSIWQLCSETQGRKHFVPTTVHLAVLKDFGYSCRKNERVIVLDDFANSFQCHHVLVGLKEMEIMQRLWTCGIPIGGREVDCHCKVQLSPAIKKSQRMH